MVNKRMDIYAPFPRKVICKQITKGMYSYDDYLLEIGKEYTVVDIEVFAYHTRIELKEFNGKCFNSCSFADV